MFAREAERVLFDHQGQKFFQHVFHAVLLGIRRVRWNRLLEGHIDAEGLRDGRVQADHVHGCQCEFSILFEW